jgi:hypothetical protein
MEQDRFFLIFQLKTEKRVLNDEVKSELIQCAELKCGKP